MKKIYLLLSFVAISALFQSCDDCPLEPVKPQEVCKTRITQIEQFNANFTVFTDVNGVITNVLDSNYNIGMFLFPTDDNSTGSYPNDMRFENAFQVPIARVPFNNNDYTIAIFDRKPSNNDLAGDILVSEVVMAPTIYADLRIAGKIRQLNGTLATEDSEVFCNWVRANKDAIAADFSPMTSDDSYRFGLKCWNHSTVNYSTVTPSIIDRDGNIIGQIGDPGMPAVPADILSKLVTDASAKKAVDLRVSTGELYAYMSKAGKRFVFLVSEIRRSPVHPFRSRVTIMFIPLD